MTSAHRIVDGIRQRHCSGCNQWHPHDHEHFYAATKQAYGLQTQCKGCTLVVGRAYSRRRTAHEKAQREFARAAMARAA